MYAYYVRLSFSNNSIVETIWGATKFCMFFRLNSYKSKYCDIRAISFKDLPTIEQWW